MWVGQAHSAPSARIVCTRCIILIHSTAAQIIIFLDSGTVITNRLVWSKGMEFGVLVTKRVHGFVKYKLTVDFWETRRRCKCFLFMRSVLYYRSAYVGLLSRVDSN